MRLYIGIDLPHSVKQSLAKSQSRLKAMGAKGSWKVPDSFHITLEFLGERSPECVPVLSQILQTVVADKRKFELCIDKPGAFPSFSRPHTVWAGVGGDLEELQSIWAALHVELEKNGFSLKKASFIPHITLLSHPRLPLPNLISFSFPQTVNFPVSDIILFESKVEEGKRIYPQLYCARLKN